MAFIVLIFTVFPIVVAELRSWPGNMFAEGINVLSEHSCSMFRKQVFQLHLRARMFLLALRLVLVVGSGGPCAYAFAKPNLSRTKLEPW